VSRGLFITGATSKVGEYLVQKLLAKTDSRLFLLIRKLPDERNIEKRFWRIFEGKVSREDFNSRIRLVSGDLGKRNLGIRESLLEELGLAEIQEVFHLAMFCDRKEFTKDSLLSLNYNGTESVLNLAQRIGASTFNHLGFLYAGAWPSSKDTDYLNFFETHSDFNNLNEFVHRMTMRLVVRRCEDHKMHYRIVNPAYLVDTETPPLIENQWYTYILQPIFQLADTYSRWKLPLILPASSEQSLALTTPEFVADVLFALYTDGSSTTDQLFNVYTERRRVRDLLSLIPKLTADLSVEFVESLEEIPWAERKIFEKSLIFFEYFLKDFDLSPDSQVADLVRRHQISTPRISNEIFLEIGREFQKQFRRKSGRIELSAWMRMLIRLRLFSQSLHARKKAA
jgi:thioester reductase-like protein